jgi:folate-dependent phosphoribosylglycinamide formyltransferase PurN
MKAWDLNLETTGCVIHKVTAGVDEGPILRQVEVSIKDSTIDEMFSTLHKTSVNLWADFLTRHWL